MTEKRHIWGKWARALHHWGLNGFAAWVLETTAPLHVIGAQFVYVGQPLMGVFWPQDQTQALAEVLEQPDQVREFVRVLQEVPAT